MCEMKSHRRDLSRGGTRPDLDSNRIPGCCVESHLLWGRVEVGRPEQAAVIAQREEDGALDSGGGNGGDEKWRGPGHSLGADLKDLHPA